jgi:hypothetical protein
MSSQRKYEHMADWLAARAAGEDPGRRPVPEQFHKTTGGLLPPPVPIHYPVSFSLFDQRTRATERRYQVDQLLKEAGVRPRRW